MMKELMPQIEEVVSRHKEIKAENKRKVSKRFHLIHLTAVENSERGR